MSAIAEITVFLEGLTLVVVVAVPSITLLNFILKRIRDAGGEVEARIMTGMQN